MAAKILTPPGVLLHPKLFKAALAYKGKPGDPLYFSTDIWFDKAAVESDAYREMIEAEDDAIRTKWGGKALKSIREGKEPFATKFRTDMAKKGLPDWVAGFMTNVRTKFDPAKPHFNPMVLDRATNPITDPAALYNGVRARISVSPGDGYDGKDGKGVTFYLGNVQKLGDGPRIEKAPTAGEMDALPPEAIADEMADMLG